MHSEIFLPNYWLYALIYYYLRLIHYRFRFFQFDTLRKNGWSLWRGVIPQTPKSCAQRGKNSAIISDLYQCLYMRIDRLLRSEQIKLDLRPYILGRKEGRSEKIKEDQLQV
jgi:hypothetical protein